MLSENRLDPLLLLEILARSTFELLTVTVVHTVKTRVLVEHALRLGQNETVLLVDPQKFADLEAAEVTLATAMCVNTLRLLFD